jgi:hypothetical protein
MGHGANPTKTPKAESATFDQGDNQMGHRNTGKPTNAAIGDAKPTTSLTLLDQKRTKRCNSAESYVPISHATKARCLPHIATVAQVRSGLTPKELSVQTVGGPDQAVTAAHTDSHPPSAAYISGLDHDHACDPKQRTRRKSKTAPPEFHRVTIKEAPETEYSMHVSDVIIMESRNRVDTSILQQRGESTLKRDTSVSYNQAPFETISGENCDTTSNCGMKGGNQATMTMKTIRRLSQSLSDISRKPRRRRTTPASGDSPIDAMLMLELPNDVAAAYTSPRPTESSNTSNKLTPAAPQGRQTRPLRGRCEDSFSKGLRQWETKAEQFLDFSDGDSSISVRHARKLVYPSISLSRIC